MKRTLAIKRRSVGPIHAPYGATEFVVNAGEDTTILYRDGLLTIKVIHNGVVVFNGSEANESAASDVFAGHTGLTYNQFNRAYEKLHPQCDFDDPLGS